MDFQWVPDWVAKNGVECVKNIAVAIALLVVGKFLIKWVVALARKALMKTCRGNPLMPDFLASIISKVLWLLLFMMAAARLGLDVAPLVAGLGITGFIVGFACQDSLANLAAGVMIAMNEPFTVGDAVTVAGVAGEIREVSMMATVVRDEATGNRVVIPNKAAWGGVITNRTKKF